VELREGRGGEGRGVSEGPIGSNLQ